MNGRRACRTDLTASLGGNRASEGGCSHPKSRDSRCQSKMMVTLSALRLPSSCQSQAWMAWLA